MSSSLFTILHAIEKINKSAIIVQCLEKALKFSCRIHYMILKYDEEKEVLPSNILSRKNFKNSVQHF